MRAFVTGATGFIGSRLVGLLRERGDDVVALVRDPARAERLGCQLVEGSVVDERALREGARGADAVFHVAGVYEVGVPASARPRLVEANVTGTARVLDAAIEAGVARIVHVSTNNVLGNTRGAIVDESHRRNLEDGFVSAYDETKWLGHLEAEERIRNGAPVVIAQFGGVYGPGDPSAAGVQIGKARAGKLKVLALGDIGLNWLHVEDAARGLTLVHDGGRTGETYILGGEIARLRDVVTIAARVNGHRPPWLELPTWTARAATPVGPLVGRIMGVGPNLRELITASVGVTYWGSDEKARRELGYEARALEQGLHDQA